MHYPNILTKRECITITYIDLHIRASTASWHFYFLMFASSSTSKDTHWWMEWLTSDLTNGNPVDMQLAKLLETMWTLSEQIQFIIVSTVLCSEGLQEIFTKHLSAWMHWTFMYWLYITARTKLSTLPYTVSMWTHTYPHKPLRKIKVTIYNHKSDSSLYVWPDAWSGDMQF